MEPLPSQSLLLREGKFLSGARAWEELGGGMGRKREEGEGRRVVQG